MYGLFRPAPHGPLGEVFSYGGFIFHLAIDSIQFVPKKKKKKEKRGQLPPIGTENLAARQL
jgi:hypothetical protein